MLQCHASASAPAPWCDLGDECCERPPTVVLHVDLQTALTFFAAKPFCSHSNGAVLMQKYCITADPYS